MLAALSILVAGGCEPSGDPRGGASATATGSDVAAASPRECPAPPIPPGIYVSTIRKADVARVFGEQNGPSDLFDLAVSFLTGRWTWYAGVADPNCFYTAWFTLEKRGEVVFVDAHPNTLLPDGKTIVLHGATEPPSPYRFELRGRVLTFQVVGYDDIRRIVAHSAAPWVRKRGP